MHFSVRLAVAPSLGICLGLSACTSFHVGFNRDTDGDGISDHIDHCPHTVRGARVDYAGCSADDDGDGVPNGLDRCPATASGHAVDFVGCATDSDCDGVADGTDLCPRTPRGVPVDQQGCHAQPVGDADRDGVPDDIDLCPRTPDGAAVNERGCEDAVKFELLGVNFSTDSTTLRDSATPTLGQILLVLRELPDRRALIDGHTDSRSTATYNYRLGLQRARAVKAWLLDRGIAAERMVIRSLGEAQPLTTNATAAGRAGNRRVEIRLAEDLAPLLPAQKGCQQAQDSDCDGVADALDRCPASPAYLQVGADGCLPELLD